MASEACESPIDADRQWFKADLGLAPTRRLVEAQGGSVDVRSAAGAGGVFSLTLPRVARDASIEGEARTA